MAEMRVFPAPKSVFQGFDGTFVDPDESDSYEDPKTEDSPTVHLEVRLKDDSVIQTHIIANLLRAAFTESIWTFVPGTYIPEDFRQIELLDKHVLSIFAELDSNSTSPFDDTGSDDGTTPNTLVFKECHLKVHVYVNHEGTYQLLGLPSDEDEDGEAAEAGDTQTPAASVLQLPDVMLDGLWQNLIFEQDVKENLLSYIQTTMLFSGAMVDPNVVSYNRVVLLHGPPGTGKTSLCRAFSQKLAIRLNSTFSTTRMVEIHAHSLFSKWFSESGKQVQKLFDSIHQLLEEDPDSFLVVLIDEVESLTAAREGVVGGKEPSDALRVVNALLTQLDRLKQHSNVLVMTTSNLTHAIDPAFIDRADIKQYIGLPTAEAIYVILGSCLSELSKKGLLKGSVALKSFSESREADATTPSRKLVDVANRCQTQGVSGRLLRRMPILAHAQHVARSRKADVTTWIDGFRAVIDQEQKQGSPVDSDPNGVSSS